MFLPPNKRKLPQYYGFETAKNCILVILGRMKAYEAEVMVELAKESFKERKSPISDTAIAPNGTEVYKFYVN